MKQEPEYRDFGSIDSVVGDLVTAGQQQAEKSQRAQRKRAARQAKIDASRNRKYIDIPPDLQTKIETLANELGVPFSQLQARLAFIGLAHTNLETLRGERVQSRSMRFQYNLDWRGPK